MTARRALSIVTAFGLCAAILLASAFWLWAGYLSPVLDGEERVPALTNPVQIEFDPYAIPHVYANAQDDVWVTMGYLHGRERLWQMELYRRAAAGRLSELFGEPLLGLDRRFLRLGLRRAASSELARAAPRVRAALERYAVGVNEAIQADGRWGLPVEFYTLGFRPEKWEPVDSLAIGKLMAWRLGENHLAELRRYDLARTFSPVEVNELMGGPPPWAAVIVEGGDRASGASGAGGAGGASGAGRAGGASRAEAPAASVGAETHANQEMSRGAAGERLPEGLEWLANGSRALSNSWVVAGSRTATGRPLLANDPHLAVEMPAIWYEAHLVAADLNVTGVTIPGIPFVVIGHNQRIAWGLTNVGTDVQDFYVERLDVARHRYLNGETWLPLRVERHEIVVRGRGPEPFEVLLTDRGPVADADEWDDPPSRDVRDVTLSDRPLALRWDVVTSGDTAGAFEALGHAANWDEFRAAVRQLAAPAQNFVYADVDGNIGYALSGLIPLRSSGTGSAPLPGWNAARDSHGFVDPATAPVVFNPPSGAIVTANNEVDRRFPHVITRDWVAPFRAARVVQLLEGQNGLDVGAFQRMQRDQVSLAAGRILPAVESAAAPAQRGKLDAPALTALDRLRLWDRRVDHRPVVTLYETFLAALWRRTFVDEMGERMFQRFYEWAARERYAGVYAIIGDPSSHWWDDRSTTDKKETRDDIVVLAADDAMRMLDRRFGREDAWAWDRVHAVSFPHPLAAGGRPLAWLFSRGPVPVTGDGDTVNKAMVNLREPYGTTEMASYRQILDVGAWDNSLSVITTGQSGHPRSPHYFDQNPLWREGRYHPLPYSRRAVVEARASLLLLVP